MLPMQPWTSKRNRTSFPTPRSSLTRSIVVAQHKRGVQNVIRCNTNVSTRPDQNSKSSSSLLGCVSYNHGVMFSASHTCTQTPTRLHSRKGQHRVAALEIVSAQHSFRLAPNFPTLHSSHGKPPETRGLVVRPPVSK